jgi:hypothetical protein
VGEIDVGGEPGEGDLHSERRLDWTGLTGF